MILDSGLVIDAIKYIELHTPPFIFVNGNDEWEIFLNKPSLEYILRFLTGVSVNHTNSQRLLGEYHIPQCIITIDINTFIYQIYLLIKESTL